MKEQNNVLLLLETLTPEQRNQFLIDALYTQNITLLELSILINADVTVANNLAICLASKNGHTETVNLLIEAGANDKLPKHDYMLYHRNFSLVNAS